MNTVNITDDTTNGVFALQSDTLYTIMSGVSVSSTTGYSLDAGTGATNRELVVNGHILGTAGVLAGDPASGKGGGKLTFSASSDVKVTDDAVHIGGDGEIVDNGGFIQGNRGLYSDGNHVSVINSGWLSGTSTALGLAGGNGSINNSGIISGFDAVVLIGGDQSKYSVINTGFINGTGERAIDGSSGVDTIRNSGKITGYVNLDWGNDIFDGRGGVVDGSVNGGEGNDRYIVDSAALVLVEDKANGTDTVRSSVSHTLAANFENLVLAGSGALTGKGNALANIMKGNAGETVLSGGAGRDTLDGGRGNDLLTGGKGADTFIFARHSGHDGVVDFHAKGAGHDQVDLSHMAGLKNFGDLLDHAGQSGKNVVLDFGHGDVLTLKHADLADLTAHDFLF